MFQRVSCPIKLLGTEETSPTVAICLKKDKLYLVGKSPPASMSRVIVRGVVYQTSTLYLSKSPVPGGPRKLVALYHRGGAA